MLRCCTSSAMDELMQPRLTDCGHYKPKELGARIVVFSDEARNAVLFNDDIPVAMSDHLLDLDVFVTVCQKAWVPSCRTRSYSSTVNERRSKQPLVEHSQMNSNGSRPPSPLARSLMFSLSVLNSDSFFARRSCRSSSTTSQRIGESPSSRSRSRAL
jgi:hypothetical protein